MTSPRPNINPEDVARADGVLRAWIAAGRPMAQGSPPPARPEDYPLLRGFLIGAMADCRHESYADALVDYRAASSDPVELLDGTRG